MSFLKHLLPGWKRGIEDKRRANAAILSALDRELKDTEAETIRSKVLLSLHTSSGEWLDQYGKIFGVLRNDSEKDENYRQRIINYVLLKRGTIPAIKDAIREFLQDFDSEIEVYEPYTNVFILNKSKLNGPDHMLGEYYTTAVMDIRLSRPFPKGIMDIINEFKPAGVTVRLTYRPGANNSKAPIIGSGAEESDKITSGSMIKIMNGMNDRIRGHLNLTARSRGEQDGSGIFILNKSKLNSSDRLTGSFAVGNPSFNLASYSTEDKRFTNSSTISDVLAETTAMSPDFYTKTGQVTDQYAVQLLTGAQSNYLHFTLDVATFFDVKYKSYLREVQSDGIYTKDTYLSLMDNTNIQYRMKAAAPPASPSPYTIQLLNIATGEWDDLDSGSVKFEVTGGKIDVDLEDYLSDSGLVFTRVRVSPNPATDNYELHMYFFELGFSKEMGVRPTIDKGTEITSQTSFVPLK